MCSVSMVVDHANRNLLSTNPQDYLSKLDLYKDLMEKAKEIDKATDQPDCESDEKLALLKQILLRMEVIDNRLNALEEYKRLEQAAKGPVHTIPYTPLVDLGVYPSGIGTITGSSRIDFDQKDMWKVHSDDLTAPVCDPNVITSSGPVSIDLREIQCSGPFGTIPSASIITKGTIVVSPQSSDAVEPNK